MHSTDLRVHTASNHSPNIFASECRSVAQHNPCADNFAILCVRDGDCSGFHNIGVAEQDVLDLNREKVLMNNV
jgi:hypothetical protein